MPEMIADVVILPEEDQERVLSSLVEGTDASYKLGGDSGNGWPEVIFTGSVQDLAKIENRVNGTGSGKKDENGRRRWSLPH